MPHFISYATGALLGAALLALLPEAIEDVGSAGAQGIGVALLLGLGVFFVTEKLVLWWHTHSNGHNHNHGSEQAHHHDHSHGRDAASGVLVIIGDSVHNGLDGVL